jgi:hypothetical protein
MTDRWWFGVATWVLASPAYLATAQEPRPPSDVPPPVPIRPVAPSPSPGTEEAPEPAAPVSPDEARQILLDTSRRAVVVKPESPPEIPLSARDTTLAIWTQPLTTAAFATAKTVHASLGGNLFLQGRYSLVVEAALEAGTDWSLGGSPSYGRDRPQFIVTNPHYFQIWGSVGVSMQLARFGPYVDLFVVPKVVGSFASDSWYLTGGLDGSVGVPGYHTESLTIGADLGVEFVYGHLYVAGVLGMGFGWCQSCNYFPGLGVDSLFGFLGQNNASSSSHLAINVNLNLLRVGVKL